MSIVDAERFLKVELPLEVADSAVPAPPPSPPWTWSHGLAYGAVSMLLGLTQGLGAYTNESAWLSIAYTAAVSTSPSGPG
ncbi:hypothetical protein [Caulobacter sp. LjRoot300]|uniref:hypothetical protein n=1 Tax=Caulobacter sp. LjRoot300 TaxID=3342321 RepID=UPI003ECD04EA